MDATGETSEYESDSSIEIITQKPKLPFTPFLQRLVDRGQLHVSGSESQDIAVGRALDAGYSHHPLPEATPYPPPHSGENINADSFGDDFISINNLPGPPRGRVRDRDMLHPLLPARKAPLTNQEKKARKATRKENRARKAALKAERVARGQVVSKAQRRLTRENVERLKTKEFNRGMPCPLARDHEELENFASHFKILSWVLEHSPSNAYSCIVRFNVLNLLEH